MKTLSIAYFIMVGGLLSLSFGQSCRVDIIALESKIKAQPDSILFALGDAIALRPDCLGDLIETAVKATEQKPGVISEIVKLAVSEYPDQAGLIAESAVIASPENVDVIRSAFQAAKSGKYKPKYVKGKLPANPSPIEQFLSSYDTSTPHDPNDVANQGLRAIDEILVKIKNNELAVAGPKEVKKKVLVAMPIVEEPVNKEVETFRMREIDYQSVTTINDPTQQDKVDELLPVEEPPLIVKDPAGPNIAQAIKKKNVELEAQRLRKVELEKLKEAAEFSSSVYSIPAPKIANQEMPLASNHPVTLRARSASPTLPTVRR